MARLARMGSPGSRRPGPLVLEAVRRVAAPPVALSSGAAVRAADEKGRLKPGFGRPVANLLGWAEGDLACHIDGCWLVLTQPIELRGARRTRNSTRAHLKLSGGERLCLSPAQAKAVLGMDRQAFLVPVPDAGALVVADPGAFLVGAPPSVARLFELPDAAPALSLLDADPPVHQAQVQLDLTGQPSSRGDAR